MVKLIGIEIFPSATTVRLLSNPGDVLERYWWLGSCVPVSAGIRLEKMQEIATARIREAIPEAIVQWSSENVHISGEKEVCVFLDCEYYKKELTRKSIMEEVQTILDEAFAEVAKEPVDVTDFP